MKEAELIGKYVLVNPKLDQDPAQKQNEVGLIYKTDIRNDEVFVNFSDGVQGLYATDALLVLKPSAEIHHNLNENAFIMAFPDLKALTQIDLMLHYASPEYLKTAMELVRDNKEIQFLSLDQLDDVVSQNRSQSFNR